MKRNLKYAEESGCGCGENVEAKKHDPRSTPAPKKDQKKGSKRNKPGSATPGGKVTFSESVTNSLKNKVKEHNKKHPTKKVSLSQLKKVYRRGAGAFSQSHRPGQTRGSWAMARVNMFLKMKRGGKVKGMNFGGKVSPRKMMAKGMMMGGKVKTKGMKKGGAVMSLAKIRSAAKSKGYKLVKS